MQIIGEASKRIDDDFKSKYPNIPWKKISGTRDRLVHDYDVVDLGIVWDIATNYLPSLKMELQQILDELKE